MRNRKSCLATPYNHNIVVSSLRIYVQRRDNFVLIFNAFTVWVCIDAYGTAKCNMSLSE